MPGIAGMNPVRSRQHNRGLITKLIATKKCDTRSDLAEYTGLSKMSMSNIVSELLQAGIVEEYQKEQPEARGRQPMFLRIGHNAPHIIGLLIWRTRVQAVLCTLDLEVLCSETIRFDTLTKDKLIQYCYEAIDPLIERDPNVLGIGVTAMGPIKIPEGIILRPNNFYGIHDVNLHEILQARYDVPIKADHDMTGAALAESMFGAGRNGEDFFFLGIDTGVGGGLVNQGDPFRTRPGLPPEVGHMTIDYEGELCSCGNKGCLEMYVNSTRVLAAMREATGMDRTYEEFSKMVDNPAIDAIMCDLTEKVGSSLVSLVNLLQVEIVVLGLDCIYWNEKYLKRLEETISERRFAVTPQKVRVCKSHFYKDALARGSAAVLLNEVFKGTIPLEPASAEETGAEDVRA